MLPGWHGMASCSAGMASWGARAAEMQLTGSKRYPAGPERLAEVSGTAGALDAQEQY